MRKGGGKEERKKKGKEEKKEKEGGKKGGGGGGLRDYPLQFNLGKLDEWSNVRNTHPCK